MKEHQTPELANRRSKDSSSKKLQKITKKSLNAVFTSVSDESSKESVELSSISEISDSNHTGEIAQSFSMEMSPDFSASSESLLPSDLTPSSTVTTENNEPEKLPLEVEIVVDFLKRSRSQILNSVEVDSQSKKLLDALLRIIVDEFYAHQPEKTDRIAELISMKTKIVLLSFLVWIIVMAMTFFSSRVQNSFVGPLPT
ncbi:protein SINE3 [Fagus crenata]